MAKLRVHNFSMSLDGYCAGPSQDLDNPMGVGGMALHQWVFKTRFGCEMIGQPGGETGLDHDFLVKGVEGIGATIMGRNMFGPIRGPWTDDEWKGWWGPTPPFHHDVFVFTHHAREPLALDGTTFHFVDDPIDVVLDQAFEAAGGQDVRLGGGTSTVQQYLRTGLIDELHIPIVPVLLGGGERLFDHLDGMPDGYECVELVSSPAVAHVRLARMTP